MFCPKCNTEVSPEDHFCPECGAPLSVQEPAAAAPDPVSAPVEGSAPIPVEAPAPAGEPAPTAPPIQTPPPTQTPPPPAYPPYSGQVPEVKKASKAPIIVLIIGVVALLAVAAFLLFRFVLNPGPAASPKDAITTALVNMQQADNYQATMEMEMSIGLLGQDMSFRMDGDISTRPERTVVGYSMSVDSGSAGISSDEAMTMYVVLEDGYATTYTNTFGYWYSDVEASPSAPEVGDPEAFSRELLDIASNLSYDGTEQVHGATADKYSFDISLAEVFRYADESQLDELDDLFDELDIDMDALFSQTEPVGVTLLVDQTTGNLAGLRVDFSDMMRTFMDSLMQEAMVVSGVSGITITTQVDSAVLDMEFFNYGNAQDVAIPAEAYSAS